MSYIITGVKHDEKYVAGAQKPKSNRASVDLIDQYNNGGLAVTSYPGVIKTIVDDQSLGTVYVGEAAPGTDEADNVWRIKRITEGGGITTIEYAVAVAGASDSTDIIGGFDHVWNDRASLTYQ
jgi:hypothetical protein